MTDSAPHRSVIIRADGSSSIGFGHIMRCVALAQGLRRAGWNPLFVCRTLDGAASAILHSYGFSFHLVPDDASQEKDAALTATLAAQTGARFAIVDHYGLQEPFRLVLKSAGLAVMVMDDIADQDCITADIILNQNLGAESFEPRYHKIAPGASLLLGASYVMFREEILSGAQAAREKRPARWKELSAGARPKIMITFGGSDIQGYTPQAMEILTECRELWDDAIVVRGPGMKDPNLIARIDALASEGFCVLDNPAMAEVMAQSDIAITAGGSSTYELALYGVAMIIVQVADNQKHICAEWRKRGLAEVNTNILFEKSGVNIKHFIDIVKYIEKAIKYSRLCIGEISKDGVNFIVKEIFRGFNIC